MVTIERGDLDSLEPVLALLRAQYAEHAITLTADVLTRAVTTVIREPARGVILVARAPDPVGLAAVAFTWTIEHGGLVAWLDELYVRPEARNQAIGHTLLARAIDEARSLGCRAVELEVTADHARASHLYERQGFAPLDRTRWSLTLV